MKEIKVRIWDNEKNQMIMPCDIPFEIDRNMQEFLELILGGCSNRYIPMLYTNRKDKNGNEIYEEDICKGKYNQWEGFDYHVGSICRGIDDEIIVKHKAGGVSTSFRLSSLHEIEIIGNKFQNPELLKEIK